MKTLKFAFFVGVIVLVSSCKSSRYIYSSPVPNSPILEGAKDASVSVQVSGKLDPDINRKRWGSDIQLAYAPINHLAFTYSFSNRKERDVYADNSHNYFDSSMVKYKHNSHEFGIGFFHTPNRDMSNHKPSVLRYLTYLPPLWAYSIFNNTKVGFSLFGGFGFGSTKIDDNGLIKPNTIYSRYLNDRYTKIFLQPSLHFFKNEYFSFSFIAKFSRLKFNRVQTNYSLDELNGLRLDNLENRTLEITEIFTNVTYKIPDIEWLQFQLNYGNAWNSNYAYNVRGATASMAVYINPFKLLEGTRKTAIKSFPNHKLKGN